MATFEEGFLYPLILLLVGAGLSGVLVTWLGHRLENRRKNRETEVESHRKELEIKVELASKMSEVRANALAEARTATAFGEEEYSKAEAEKVFEKIKKWFGEVNLYAQNSKPITGRQSLLKHGLTIGLSSSIIIKLLSTIL